MDIKTKLISKFPVIIDVYYEKEGQNHFLRVETKLKKLDQIEQLTHQVSKFLDEINYSDSNYYLDIFSSGATLSEQELQLLSEE